MTAELTSSALAMPPAATPDQSDTAAARVTPPTLRRQLPPTRRAARAAATAAEAPDRRLNILLAAERLFGEHGFHGVSMRDIAQAADVPVALVSYHFGAKNELYHAIFESWRPMIEARLRTLAEVSADLSAPDALERVLAAWVFPLLDLARHPEGQHYAQMATRDMANPTPESERAQNEFFDPMAHAFIDVLMRLFPSCSRQMVARCYQFMLGTMLLHLSDQRVKRLGRGQTQPGDLSDREALLRYLAAGFRGVLGAPVPSGPP